MINIQVFSDLHLEDLNSNINIEKHSDILFLAGDIGHIDDPKYINFLDMCSNKWKVVISVLEIMNITVVQKVWKIYLNTRSYMTSMIIYFY